MILTEQDLERALNKEYQETLNKLVECADLMLKGNQMLVENKLSEKDYEILQEGLWEKAKYYMAKMGRYKAGGKIFGKGKVDQEAAAKIQQLLDKKGNEMIKSLNSKIKGENPEFPNNEKGDDFLKTVMEIAAVYDSVVAATKKKPEEEGYLPTDAANAIIADLAEYVKKFLDVDLAAAYTVMDSEEEKVKNKKDDDEDEESEEGEEELLTDDIEGINEDKAADVRKELQAKKGKDGVDRESIRFSKKGLASNRLPLFLNVAGGLLGLASWVTQTDWFKEMFTKLEQLPPEKHTAIINSYVNQNVGIDPKGFSYTLQNNLPKAPIDGAPSWANNAVGLKLGPNAPLENLKKAAEFYGQGDVNKGIEVMGKQFLDKSVQGDSIANLKAQLADTAKNKTVGDVFNHAEKTYGSSGELFKQANPASVKGFLVKILTSKVVTWMSTGATVASIPVGVAKLIAAGPVLAKVGVVLILTGAIVKLMRMKGKKQSRAKTLQDLLNSMQPVKATEASLPPILPPPPNPAVEGGAGGKNICNAKNLNEINKLLNKVKADSKNFAVFADYMKDDEFRDIFFSAIADVNQSIKINKQPLVKTLASLRSQGLIEAPTGRQRKYLKFKLDFQNFMNDVFKLFALLSKNCKNSQTSNVIKEFYKQLYVIATQGKNAGVKSRVQFDKMGPEKKEAGMTENNCKNLPFGTVAIDEEKNKRYVVIDPMKYLKDKENAEAYEKERQDGYVYVRRIVNGKAKGGASLKQCSELKPVSEKTESVLKYEDLLNEDANKDLRNKLFKKLAGNFNTFLKALNKLKPMEKGKEGKPSEKEIAKRREAKKGKGGEKGTEGEFAGSAPRTKPPELAHHDRGDNYLNEEIKKIKSLMTRI